jgi:hypothetical protein
MKETANATVARGVDEYLLAFAEEVQTTLEAVRQIIRTTAPQA